MMQGRRLLEERSAARTAPPAGLTHEASPERGEQARRRNLDLFTLNIDQYMGGYKAYALTER